MPPRAGAGGPSSEARQREGPKRSRAGAGALRGLPGRGAGARRGPMAAGGGPVPVFLGLQRVQLARGAGGWGRRGRAKGQAGGGQDALRASPRAPWRPGRPRPRRDPREHCSGAGRGRGCWGVGRALPSRRGFCATWKVRMCSEDTSAERRRGRGPDIHTQCGPWAGEKSLQSLPAWRAPRGGRRCADSGLPLLGVGGSGVTLRLFPDGTEARNFVSFLP